jgi:uncharacterized protein (DUF362 family)
MLTRRQFVQRMVALGLGGTSLAALRGVPGFPATWPAQAGQVATPPADAAYLSVARGEDPAELTRRAVKALGGIERFVKQGQSVIIKPNICVAYHPPEYAATTNPQVVAALVTMCKEAGASSVRVMDNPFGGTAREAYKISQIEEAVQAAGGEMVIMNPAKFKETDIPQGESIKSWPVYQDVLSADVLINVPIAKNHSLTRLTLGAKNLMGLVKNREGLHFRLSQNLPDLVTLFKPKLTVVDAYRILTANGPTGGSLDDVKLTKTIIASHDIVAADTYAASLFDMKPINVTYIQAGASRGLGTSDLTSIKIEEIAVQ